MSIKKKYLMNCKKCGAAFWKASPNNSTKCPRCGGSVQILRPRD